MQSSVPLEIPFFRDNDIKIVHAICTISAGYVISGNHEFIHLYTMGKLNCVFRQITVSCIRGVVGMLWDTLAMRSCMVLRCPMRPRR